jgi:hypothetical protein
MLNGTKQNIVAGFLIGSGLSTGWFVACFFLSQLPVVSPVSLALSFQPWWRYWEMSVVLFVLPFVIAGALRVRERMIGGGT